MKAFTEMTIPEQKAVCRALIVDMMDICIMSIDIEIIDVDVVHISWKVNKVYFAYSVLTESISIVSADGDEDIIIINNISYEHATRYVQ